MEWPGNIVSPGEDKVYKLGSVSEIKEGIHAQGLIPATEVDLKRAALTLDTARRSIILANRSNLGYKLLLHSLMKVKSTRKFG